ncbi:MAG: hypothetical protein Ct9H300mP16_07110 [Pseudomonadota bacterium]|nr:MAG: hypothetical protein Ct9H300mP16_07110 [Pseudomonadota bacterium]
MQFGQPRAEASGVGQAGEFTRNQELSMKKIAICGFNLESNRFASPF